MLSGIRNIPNRALILPICCFLAIFCQFNTENIFAAGENPKFEKDAVPESHLTLEAAINTALRANREILVSGRGVKDRHLALAKSRSDFNLKIFRMPRQVSTVMNRIPGKRSVPVSLSIKNFFPV